MNASNRDRIAELLQRKLMELRERDGDLSDRRAGKTVRPPVAIPDNSPSGRDVPVIGGFFDPASRLESISSGRQAEMDHVEASSPGRLIEKFIGLYHGSDPAEIIGRELGSSCRRIGPGLLEVFRPVGVDVSVVPRSQAVAAISASLWLIPGIRDRVAGDLCDGGLFTLDSLAGHGRFGPAAGRLVRSLDRGDIRRISAVISGRGGAAHPLNLALSAWFEPSDLLFLDIETGGLFGGSPIVVAGLASVPAGDGARGVTVRILAASTPDGEADLVRLVADEIRDHKVLVTFNGRAFDFPYVCQRAAYYGMVVEREPFHLDLLGYSRRRFRGLTTDCRLSTLACEILGMKRDEDVPGAMVPVFYEAYLRDPQGAAGLLAAITIHNFLDMEQTIALFNEHVARFCRGESQAGPSDPGSGADR